MKKRYLALFISGLTLLLIVSAFAFFSRTLVCRIWQLDRFALPNGGVVWAHRSEIDRLGHPPDPTRLPGVELRRRALILLVVGDWAREYFVLFALPGSLLVYFGLRGLKRQLDQLGTEVSETAIPGPLAPSPRRPSVFRFGVRQLLVWWTRLSVASGSSGTLVVRVMNGRDSYS